MDKIIVMMVLLFSFGACNAKVEVKTINRLKAKAKEAKTYCETNNLNLDMCILVDMQIHSGKKDFFYGILKATQF